MSETEPGRYPYTFSRDVVFGDLDAMGHLNNLVLLRLMETGRIGYMVHVGLAKHDELTYVLARVEADFRSQGRFGETLTCGTRVSHIGRTSFTMEHAVWRGDMSLLASGLSVLVALGADKATPISVPEQWRRVINDREKDTTELASTPSHHAPAQQVGSSLDQA